MTDKTTYNFDEYIRQGEPDKRQKAENWQTKFGIKSLREEGCIERIGANKNGTWKVK